MWHGGRAISLRSAGFHADRRILLSVRIFFDFSDALGQLVHTLASVICVHVHVLRSEMAPLKTVHGTEVALFAMSQAAAVKKFPRTVTIPYLDPLLRQVLAVRVTLDEPQQLFNDTTPEDALRC